LRDKLLPRVQAGQANTAEPGFDETSAVRQARRFPGGLTRGGLVGIQGLREVRSGFPPRVRQEDQPKHDPGTRRVGSDQLPHSKITAASGTVSLSLQSALHHSITLLVHYRFRWPYSGWTGVQLPASGCTMKQHYSKERRRRLARRHPL